MFLRCTTPKKNGKELCYWFIVVNKRCASRKIVQRHVFYLGEVNDQQQAAWQKPIDIFEAGQMLALICNSLRAFFCESAKSG
jgi:hypothetical protein